MHTDQDRIAYNKDQIEALAIIAIEAVEKAEAKWLAENPQVGVLVTGKYSRKFYIIENGATVYVTPFTKFGEA